MSVFSLLRRSRQQAKEFNQKQVDKQKAEEEKKPYKHVPTHAAIDALSGAPSGWRNEDRPRILEQNRRRSAMAASGMNMGMPPIPRVASSLSHVMYPSNYATPMVNLPRTYSYNSVHHPAWQSRSNDVVYSAPESVNGLIKGKELEKTAGADSGRASAASSSGVLPSIQCVAEACS
jgi:hypothetical protein